jgi:hypothetical protein
MRLALGIFAGVVVAVSLSGCRGSIIPPPELPPPFSARQPTPDWSDPARQARVAVTKIECLGATLIGPVEYREAGALFSTQASGWCLLWLRVQLTGKPSKELRHFGIEMECGFIRIAPFVATVRENDGTMIRVVDRVRRGLAPGEIPISYTPQLPPHELVRAGTDTSDTWHFPVDVGMLLSTRPRSEVEIAIDGEALRKAIEGMYPRRSHPSPFPPGAVTGGTFRVTIPEPKHDHAPLKSPPGC